MEPRQPEPMTPFDEITVPRQLRFLKLLLPFLPASNRQMLGILIKSMELQHTIQLFQNTADSIFQQISENGRKPLNNPADLLEMMLPYLSSEELETANTFRSAMSMMEMMQMFSQQREHSNEDPSFHPMDMMMGMLSPEQQEMFENYQAMFSDLNTDPATD